MKLPWYLPFIGVLSLCLFFGCQSDAPLHSQLRKPLDTNPDVSVGKIRISGNGKMVEVNAPLSVLRAVQVLEDKEMFGLKGMTKLYIRSPQGDAHFLDLRKITVRDAASMNLEGGVSVHASSPIF